MLWVKFSVCQQICLGLMEQDTKVRHLGLTLSMHLLFVFKIGTLKKKNFFLTS